jgi:hypothetical protein
MVANGAMTLDISPYIEYGGTYTLIRNWRMPLMRVSQNRIAILSSPLTLFSPFLLTLSTPPRLNGRIVLLHVFTLG